MSDQDPIRGQGLTATPTLRELAMVLFRRRQIFLWVSGLVLAAAILFALVGTKYEANMKVLVRRGRANAPVTAGENAPLDLTRVLVTEEELNSEVELLRDDDVLRTVVKETGLGGRDWFHFLRMGEGNAERMERAARRLASRLAVEPVKKTNLIVISYAADDPQIAAKDGPVLYFGRLSEEKGVADLLRAMRKVPQMRLVVAGDGPQRGELQKLADSLSLSNVEFVGHMRPAERDSLITRSKFTVLPSHAYETLGKIILESYAEGRAVVASDLGSRRELVQDGVTGLLYRPGDVDQLAGAIQSLGAKPESAEKMGLAGWEMVRRHHTPDAHYQRLLSLYEGLVAHKEIRHPTRSVLLEKVRSPSAPSTTNEVSITSKSKKALRIAFIGGRGVSSKYSGIETYYEEVGKRLAEMGHEVTLYCRSYFTPAMTKYNGMRVVRLPTVRSKHLETLIHTFLSTIHAVTQGYDIVHYHALGPALFSFLPRLFGKKTAVTVQGLDWQRKKWGRLASAVLQLGERVSGRFPNGTIVVSQVLQRRYNDVHGVQALYVANGGILRERSEPKKILEWGLEPGKYILFLGRFSPEKGCHLLVGAFEQIETDVKLVMAGPSSYCEEYSRELHGHASDRIRIFESVSGETLDELISNAMLFVLPSDLEGMSMALLAAMGAGLCVLTSDVPENRELVEGAGFTFRAGSVTDLADRLRYLIANPGVREATGRSAKKRIEEQYQWQRISVDMENAYFQLMGWERPQAPGRKPVARAITADKIARPEQRVS